MKITFLTPPMGMWVYFGKMRSIYPGFAQLAAYLLEKTTDVEVDVLDCPAFDLNHDQMIEELKKRNPDLIGMGCGTTWVHCIYDAARKIKKAMPNVKIVCGGMHFNALSKESLGECPEIDFAVIGEGENTLLELTQELAKPNANFRVIDGLCFREKDNVILNGPRAIIDDLDSLPLPAYHLFPLDKYYSYTYWPKAVRIVTSRGCAGRCYFCFQWNQYDGRRKENVGRWRGLSGKRIADQAELLVKKYGTQMFEIQDDDFNSQTERIEEFCDEILKRKLEFSWMFLGRADKFVEQTHLYKKMRQSGCILTLIGIEAETDEKLKAMGKNITLAQIKEAITKLRENDISTCGTVMIGFWEDDETTIKKRAETLDWLDPDLMTVQILVPYPGTEFWEEMKNSPRREIKDFRFYDMAHAVMPTKYLSRDDLNRFAGWMNREFYSKPERVHRMLYGYTSPLVGACCRSYMEVVPKVEECFTKGIPFI
ncbi:MAG: radical SAM protein [Candidatus Omnitrophota bacterium]